LCFGLSVMSYRIVPDNQLFNADSTGFDYLGAFTGVTGLVLFNVAWNQGPVVGWTTPYVYVLLIVGSLFLVAFVAVEYSYAIHPLIPLKALSLETGLVLACIAFGWSSFGIWLFYLWQIIEVFRTVSPLLASAQFLPAAFAGLAASMFTGFALNKMPTALVIVLSMMAFCTGSILVATMPIDQTYWAQTFLTLLVTPFGMDMSFPAATLILSATCGKEHQGVAASLVNTVVNYSISIGLGIAGTVESNINNGGDTADDALEGIRGALYSGIVLSGLGVIVALIAFRKNQRKLT
jgi:hypothetical protein